MISSSSKLDFAGLPSNNWASIIGLRSFAIMKHAHPAAMPFHSFPIHFRFSYIFFDWIFQKYPCTHRLAALVLRVAHPSSLRCSHGRRHPLHGTAIGLVPPPILVLVLPSLRCPQQLHLAAIEGVCIVDLHLQ